nr:Ppx/GppA phosphatase family protein [Ahrensia sp. R2A130]
MSVPDGAAQQSPQRGAAGDSANQNGAGRGGRRRTRRRGRRDGAVSNEVPVGEVPSAPVAPKTGKRAKRPRGDNHSTLHSANGRKNHSANSGAAMGNDRPHLQTAPRVMGNLPAYAALDLGTNNCRLLVAVPQQPGRFRVIDAFSRIVRLGEGLGASGRLSEGAMDRAVGALKACAAKLENREVAGVRLIATEACRRAENGEEFLARVEQEAGLKLEIIDRETEARLAVAGCSSLVDRKSKGAVLFDIGGGSSELALLDLSKRNRHDLGPAMVAWTSLPMGVVTLSEKHGGGKLVTRPVFDAMVDEVAEHLQNFEGRDALAEALAEDDIHLLGTSGTVTTLAGIHLKLPRYERRLVDGIWMDSRKVEQMVQGLVDMSFEQRVQNPCIGKDRADLVLAGCAILVAIQQLWPCTRLRVADRGLREGLLTQMMNADDAWQRGPRPQQTRRADKSSGKPGGRR